MVDKAAIFTDVTRRNALRRGAKLPLLDVQPEFVHAVEVATWSEAYKEHADDIASICEQAEVDFRNATAPMVAFQSADAGKSCDGYRPDGSTWRSSPEAASCGILRVQSVRSTGRDLIDRKQTPAEYP
jgi:hypothetical protein